MDVGLQRLKEAMMDKGIPTVGGICPMVVGVLPKQPRRVALESRTPAEGLGAPLAFAYVAFNSYLVEWELKDGIRGSSLHPQAIDEDMTEDARDILRVRDSAMAGSKITWSFRVLAGDPGKALAWLGNELHTWMILIAHQQLPVVVTPAHHEGHSQSSARSPDEMPVRTGWSHLP